MLELDNVVVRLGEHRVLHHVSFDVPTGDTAALLGPSGCGKTTLLRAIAGLQPLESGAIVLDGHDLAGVPPHERGVGLMFQDYALFPHRTVAQNVEFGLRMRGQAREQRRARVGEVLALIGMEGFEERSVTELSGGERQRVALARSLAPAPSLLMLDEPLGSLDRTLRDRLVLDLRELFASQGLTVLYVTHDQSEALALADQVSVLEAGRVIQSASPQQLWAQPASPFVARFLGFTNLLDVEAIRGDVHASFGIIGRVSQWPDGPATALVRPDAIEITESSGVVARVRSCAFGGDHSTVELDVGDGLGLDAVVNGPSPQIGASVGITIRPSGLQLFQIVDEWNGRPDERTPE
jgi:thiamine transport system ATP-binding protein